MKSLVEIEWSICKVEFKNQNLKLNIIRIAELNLNKNVIMKQMLDNS